MLTMSRIVALAFCLPESLCNASLSARASEHTSEQARAIAPVNTDDFLSKDSANNPEVSLEIR